MSIGGARAEDGVMRIALWSGILLLVAGVAATVGLAVMADAFQRTDERQHVVRGSVSRVIVEGSNGDVSLRTSSAARVTVREQRRFWLRAPKLDLSLRDGVLRVAASCDGWAPGCSDDLEIAAPPSVRATDVSVDSGDVSVATRDASRIVATSDSGDVEVHGSRGAVEASTGSGDVSAEDVRGPLTMATDSGDVSGRRLRSTTVSGSSDSGDVSIGVLVTPRSVAATTDSGDVDVAVPSDRYRLDAETDSGDVALERIFRDDLAPHRIDARTDSGDVLVRGR
jgi:hypothetical protein